MYEYKSEVLYTKTKWTTDKAEDSDLFELDNLINQRAQEGWELVTYSYMSTSLQLKGATLITFKKAR
ncbi:MULTISPECIES: DUF4177 domain-containing protein [Enterococcus]|jgi:hypothetical protein|uniref:DUF4177 domain-containing protein n=1 Tax=Enterococcus gilvus ATCC BAA-350 TaxID=1158614 RepID=R2VMB8_9ENTE|nr:MULTISPECIES: DUF4177 domain-containing protein [Enterococcus]AXG40626.1 DUF4177 domain-containing protein [Enterococcus gilvus]EOI58980.1 hypothetical protein UKC_00166 [Enterococcus gilvus ATCC BAA-350]EOW79143.1 hypothetical protein I592_03281 [Enterococcus gilvus ATCC BAA-350]MDU5511995.1 DUF4177 domain-containing protein [Enterococcus gilvus]OJG43793.1 hypothetical protein RV02_GL002177 [Enterococcus gilvus]